MVLKSYAFMQSDINIAFYYEIFNEIQKLKWYFYKFAGVNAEEAMQRTLYHTLFHFNSSKGNLSAYIKKLAREITKENNRLVLVDFLEQTLSEDSDDEELKSTVDIGSVNDFSNSVITDIELNEDRRIDVINLALEFMDKFLLLCEALIAHDTSTRYYPDIFIRQCLSINKRCPNFNALCLDVYLEYKDDFEWFLGLTEGDDDWKEPDFVAIANSYSKRVLLVDPVTKKPVENADVDKFKLSGKLGDKRIVRVRYYELWEYFCDLIDDTETNEMKFIIGNSYIIKSFGGSLSVLNPDLFNMYDLARTEILTNVLQDTYGRILNIGTEYFYILCGSDFNKTTVSRTVHGHSFDLVYEDITDLVQQ